MKYVKIINGNRENHQYRNIRRNTTKQPAKSSGGGSESSVSASSYQRGVAQWLKSLAMSGWLPWRLQPGQRRSFEISLLQRGGISAING